MRGMALTGLALTALALVAMMAAQVLAAPTRSATGDTATVNSYTPAQADRARAAVTRAGYTPEEIAAVQDGNFFFNAARNGQPYQVTVTHAGKVYVTSGTAAASCMPEPRNVIGSSKLRVPAVYFRPAIDG